MRIAREMTRVQDDGSLDSLECCQADWDIVLKAVDIRIKHWLICITRPLVVDKNKGGFSVPRWYRGCDSALQVEHCDIPPLVYCSPQHAKVWVGNGHGLPHESASWGQLIDSHHVVRDESDAKGLLAP